MTTTGPAEAKRQRLMNQTGQERRVGDHGTTDSVTLLWMLVNEKETTNRHLTAYNHLLVRTIEEKDALIEDMKEKIAALSRKQHASPASATVLSSACQMALEALHSAAGAFEVEKSWGDLQHFAHELYEKHEVFQGFVQQLGPAAVPEPATGSITALQRMCQQQGDQQQQSLALFGTDTGAMELARMIAGTKPGRGEVIITGLLARASFRAAVSIPCPEHLPVTILSGAPPSIDIDEKSLDQDAEQIIMSGDDVALILTAWRPVTTKSVKSAVGVILINGLPYVYVLQPPTRRLTLFGNESWHEVTAESIFHLVVEEAFSEDDQWKLTTATFDYLGTEEPYRSISVAVVVVRLCSQLRLNDGTTALDGGSFDRMVQAEPRRLSLPLLVDILGEWDNAIACLAALKGP